MQVNIVGQFQLDRVAYIPEAESDLESMEEFFRFDLVIWVSHVSNATLLQQLLGLDDHKLEVRLFLGD